MWLTRYDIRLVSLGDYGIQLLRQIKGTCRCIPSDVGFKVLGLPAFGQEVSSGLLEKGDRAALKEFGPV